MSFLPHYQTIYTFLLFFPIYILGSVQCYGYFSVEPKGNEEVYEKLRTSVQWEKGRKVFAVYDNFNHPFPQNSQEPLLFPASDKFIPSDLIDINIPVYNVLRHPINLDYSISDLLYANLKLKIMQDEYAELQKRAHELKSSSSDPSKKEGKPIETLNSKKEPKKNREIPKESIQTIRNRLQKQSNSVIRHAWIPFEPAEATVMQTLDQEGKDDKEGDILVLDHLPVPYINKLFSNSSSKKRNPKDLTNSKTGRNLAGNTGYTLNSSAGKSLHRQPNKSENVSTFLLLPRKIIEYFAGNKFEAILFGALLLFLLLIATSVNPGYQSESK